jgi:hypothetical protein
MLKHCTVFIQLPSPNQRIPKHEFQKQHPGNHRQYTTGQAQ